VLELDAVHIQSVAPDTDKHTWVAENTEVGCGDHVVEIEQLMEKRTEEDT
jgi:hypothetical protein